MAPLSVVLIGENLSQKEGEQFCLKECLSRAKIASVGVFFIGFSAGSATQVHFRSIIPRSFRAFLLLPLISGISGAYTAHDFFRNRCIRQWILSDQTPFNPRARLSLNRTQHLRVWKGISAPEREHLEVVQEIDRLTVKSQDHLTPELSLHLITPQCPLWHSPGDECPFDDPFWAFYWPGGQALTRFLLDNSSVTKGHSVLDVGSGCAASAIAAVKSGAQHVTANDICPVAAVAIDMNAKLNGTKLSISTDNFIGQPCQRWDVILLGDMFYDPKFADIVFEWLKQMSEQGKAIYIGDPGRLSFLSHPATQHLQRVASYELLDDCKQENNGLTQGCVWKFS